MKSPLDTFIPKDLKNRLMKCRKPPKNAVFGPNLR